MPVAAIAFAASAVATGASIYEQSRGAAAQEQAVQLERQRNDLTIAQKERDTIRQANIARGQSEQSAANQGNALSSSAIGGQGSISTQLGENLSFLDTYKNLSDQASVDMENSSKDYSLSKTFTSVANFAGEFADGGSGQSFLKQVGSWFGGSRVAADGSTTAAAAPAGGE